MRLHTRRGIALVAALGLMTLLGLMIAGAFAASQLGERSARLTQSDAALGASADYAITTILGDAQNRGLADFPLGQARSFDVAIPDAPSVRATVDVTRLPAGVLWLVADAAIAGVDQGHRRINLVARYSSLGALPAAAIVAHGNVIARDSVSFGVDTTGDADCATPSTNDIIQSLGATSIVQIGTRVGTSASAGDSATYYMTLQQRARLDTTGTMVHVRGDTTIAGGTLTGILIVDGSLVISGPLTVAGIIVVRGSINAIAGGLSLTGAMMAYGAPTNGGTTIEIANATIRYGPCIVANALRHAARPTPVRQRSWAELF
jgi:hypothetical protein